MEKHLQLILTFLLLINFSFAQEGIVSGIMKDNSGETLIGVPIQIKGTTLGTVTDIDGNVLP